VVNYPDGRFAVRHEGIARPFRVFGMILTVASGAIVENKRLARALAFARGGRRRIRQTVGGAIHDASGRQTTWRHRVCRQRAAHRARFWQPLRTMTFEPCGEHMSPLRNIQLVS
jgi:hypothetical protein